ncbi:MAG: hypothetical protein NTZ73_04580 [Candidatus Diapherotrites archaeon]|nr:hypothetical protein [Candidatus Diapherotrites archaeon]
MNLQKTPKKRARHNPKLLRRRRKLYKNLTSSAREAFAIRCVFYENPVLPLGGILKKASENLGRKKQSWNFNARDYAKTLKKNARRTKSGMMRLLSAHHNNPGELFAHISGFTPKHPVKVLIHHLANYFQLAPEDMAEFANMSGVKGSLGIRIAGNGICAGIERPDVFLHEIEHSHSWLIKNKEIEKIKKIRAMQRKRGKDIKVERADFVWDTSVGRAYRTLTWSAKSELVAHLAESMHTGVIKNPLAGASLPFKGRNFYESMETLKKYTKMRIKDPEERQKLLDYLGKMEKIHEKNREALVPAIKRIPVEDLIYIINATEYHRLAPRLAYLTKKYAREDARKTAEKKQNK